MACLKKDLASSFDEYTSKNFSKMHGSSGAVNHTFDLFHETGRFTKQQRFARGIKRAIKFSCTLPLNIFKTKGAHLAKDTASKIDGSDVSFYLSNLGQRSDSALLAQSRHWFTPVNTNAPAFCLRTRRQRSLEHCFTPSSVEQVEQTLHYSHDYSSYTNKPIRRSLSMDADSLKDSHSIRNVYQNTADLDDLVLQSTTRTAPHLRNIRSYDTLQLKGNRRPALTYEQICKINSIKTQNNVTDQKDATTPHNCSAVDLVGIETDTRSNTSLKSLPLPVIIISPVPQTPGDIARPFVWTHHSGLPENSNIRTTLHLSKTSLPMAGEMQKSSTLSAPTWARYNTLVVPRKSGLRRRFQSAPSDICQPFSVQPVTESSDFVFPGPVPRPSHKANKRACGPAKTIITKCSLSFSNNYASHTTTPSPTPAKQRNISIAGQKTRELTAPCGVIMQGALPSPPIGHTPAAIPSIADQLSLE
ncbi:hypothetical protein BDF19DRAFT_439905 [Syncephalis fuscata]|nr:hypothetical protein BDF19DRAFT_439905 [Syncephalis fuscata]